MNWPKNYWVYAITFILPLQGFPKMPPSTKTKLPYGSKDLKFLDKISIRARLKYARYAIQKYISMSGNLEPRIIETGCGYFGLNLHALAKEFSTASFVGMDLTVSPKWKNPRINLIETDLNRETLTAKGDVILSLAVVEHLEEPIEHFLTLRSMCESQSLVTLTTPAPQSHIIWASLKSIGLIQEDQSHLSYLTPEGIYNLAEKSQLAVIEFRHFEFGINQFALFTPKKQVLDQGN